MGSTLTTASPRQSPGARELRGFVEPLARQCPVLGSERNHGKPRVQLHLGQTIAPRTVKLEWKEGGRFEPTPHPLCDYATSAAKSNRERLQKGFETIGRGQIGARVGPDCLIARLDSTFLNRRQRDSPAHSWRPLLGPTPRPTSGCRCIPPLLRTQMAGPYVTGILPSHYAPSRGRAGSKLPGQETGQVRPQQETALQL